MSVRRARLVFVVALAAAAGPVLGIAAHAAPSGPTPPAGYNATINQGNVPTTAGAYSQDCNSDEFGNKPAADDGWLFVASPSNFQKLQAQFNDGANVVNFDGNNTAEAYYTKVGDHVAVITPGGWTLTQAFAQLNGDKDFFTLSHTCAATQPQQQPQSTPASATPGDHSCDSVTFNLSAGSEGRTFVIHQGSDTTNVPVGAGQTKQQVVSLDSTHPSASVTESGNELASFTRPDSCNSSTQPGDSGDTGGNGNTPGTTGGTTPGTTGGTTQGGTTSGGTTPTVAGETGQQGGTTTSVLGEKLTKTPGTTTGSTPTSVEATGISALPMTGFNARGALEIAAGFLLLGVGASTLGRRRIPAPRYIQVRN